MFTVQNYKILKFVSNYLYFGVPLHVASFEICVYGR